MREAIPPLPNTPSWSSARLEKHRENFTFTFYTYTYMYICIRINRTDMLQILLHGQYIHVNRECYWREWVNFFSV